VRPVPPPMPEEINLLEAAGGAVAKRAIPAITALLLLALLIRRLRRRRQRARRVVHSTAPTSAPLETSVQSSSRDTPATALVDLGDGGA
jgi:C4-dicarboxylate-specific signal transduction histidine kinase